MELQIKKLQELISSKIDIIVVTHILENFFNVKNVTLNEISINSDFKKGESYLSTLARFSLTAIGDDKRNGEKTDIVLPLISKALPKNVGHKKTFRSPEFFKNEVAFYDTVWVAMKEFQNSKNLQWQFKEIPLCVSAFADGIHDYIVMEDLNFKGYVGVSRSTALDFAHAQLFMRQFAKFHALGLAFKTQRPKEFEEAANSLQETYFCERLRGWYHNFQNRTLFAVVRDAIEKELPKFYLDKVDALFATDFYGMLIRHCAERGRLAVITHGDAWVPNFLIKYDDKGNPVDVVMIDFQLARYSSLALDITFFLYSCIEQNLLFKCWDQLVEDYHETFVNTLEHLGSSADLLNLEDLKLEIKKCAPFGIGMSMEALVMSLIDDNEVADLDSIPDKQVPLEDVWIVRPFKSQAKRQRISDMMKHAIDNDFI